MICPHCRSRLRTLRRPDECPKCGRPLVDESGHGLRTLDENYEHVRRELDENSMRRLKQGAIVVGALSLLTAVPVAGALFSLLIVVAHFVWCRTLLCVPWSRHYGRGRRIVTRWISRFAVASAASLHGSLAVATAVPFVAAIAHLLVSPALTAATAGACWWYHRWHLERERDRKPVHPVEKVLVVVAALIAIVLFVGVIALAVGIGSLLESGGG